MNFNQAISQNFNNPTVDSTVDPIRLSNRLSLPFPVDGASQLGAQRSNRYDDFFFTLDDAEFRLRELASIMGMWSIDDDTPTAA